MSELFLFDNIHTFNLIFSLFFSDSRQQEVEWKEALEQKSLIYRFFNAIYLAAIARTEFICYFFMVLCHIKHGNILSLPLPVAAITWGMLSLPRPAKTFWISVLTYVMVSQSLSWDMRS